MGRTQDAAVSVDDVDQEIDRQTAQFHQGNLDARREDHQDVPGVDPALLAKYFHPVDMPEDADFAIVFMDSPSSGGYDKEKGYASTTTPEDNVIVKWFHTKREEGLGMTWNIILRL